MEIRGQRYPIGDLYFGLGGVKVGFEICEDAWVASRPGSDMAGRGVDVILNPSASHFAFDKIEVRKRFVVEGSRAFGVTYVYANLLGNDAGRIVYDGGAMIARSGTLVALGRRFAYHDVDVISAIVDVSQTRMQQSWTNSFRPRFDESPGECVRAEFSWPDIDPAPDATSDDDLALQNIQARVRGPSVWMLANIRGALLVSTSNRSEAAVGYATMDGDTCGGISPIAGIDKAFLRSWLRWLDDKGPEGLGPIPAVRAVNVQQPTAELRPAERSQTDETDLMPYPLLDAIEEAAIRDKHDPVETFKLMRVMHPDIEPRQLGLWVERFFVLWCRNQWKRERYAPSFHVDDTNLDPKTWCRFPILSSGYERELDALRVYVRELPK